MNPTLITTRHIVIRGVNWLGDAVMTTPAVLRLRERFPEARITVLCPEKLHDLWVSHPAVDAVQTFKTGEKFLSVARRLRSIDADLAVIFPNSLRSALETWWAGIPRRLGSESFLEAGCSRIGSNRSRVRRACANGPRQRCAD